MHILLTDVLTCPRCGPEFGLILLADAMAARRVRSGSLGCANCRERYPIVAGVADLRPPAAPSDSAAGPDQPASGAAAPPRSTCDAEAALRLAALLDLTDGGGVVLLVGPAGRLAARVAAHLAPGEVVVAAGDVAEMDGGGVSRVALPDARLPFASRSLRGAVLAGPAAGRLLEEAARVVAPMRRLVLEEAPASARERLARAGLEILAEEEGTLVALRRDQPDPPRLYQLL
ncbi:MAG TPA: hypothetical protein VMK65_03630 [Longimicrobiales bacterium]|nr:hypothetical protein [Longimicrobiales bacterium]